MLNILEIFTSPEVQEEVTEAKDFFTIHPDLGTAEDIVLLTQFLEKIKWVNERWGIH